MAPWQRNANVRSSNTWDTKCITNYTSGSMRRSAAWQNDLTEVTISTADKATSTIATTTSGRIAMTAVIAITTTNIKKTREQDPFQLRRQGIQAMPGAKTKEQAHLQGVPQIPQEWQRQLQDKKCQYKVHYNDACYTSDDDESRSSTNTPVPSEDPASASSKSKKTMRMRIIIFKLIKKWRQVAMCLPSLTIDSMGPKPSWRDPSYFLGRWSWFYRHHLNGTWLHRCIPH